MSFPRYPNYKDSGVEWLGEVPEHWLVTKTKHVVQFTTGWTPPTGESASYEGANLWANISDLGPKCLLDTAKRVSDNAIATSRMSVSPKGSLMFSFKLSIGQVSFAGQDMFTNEAIATFLPSSHLSLAFAYYAFPLLLVQNAAENIYGAKLLNQELIRSASFALPSFPEQTQIAAFLDRETAKIDELVAEQRRLMELLKEKRQAVISHAVTQGMNPHAPMKPSGIEWLGDVPRGWAVRPLKHLARLQTGMTPPTDDLGNYTEDDVFQWVRPEDLNETGTPTTASKFLTEQGWSKTRQITAGSSLICCIGTIGKVGIVNTAVSTNQQITAAVPREDCRYLFYAICSGRAELELASTGNVLRILNTERLGKICFPNPPLPEQTQITAFLDSELAKFDTLTAEAQHAIDLLQERRTALISAAVTGQIDVRQLSQAQKVGAGETATQEASKLVNLPHENHT